MKTKLIAFATNSMTGVTETEREMAGNHLGGKIDERLIGNRVFTTDNTTPIYLRTRITCNNIDQILHLLLEMKNPVVIEFEPRNPYLSDTMYEKNIHASFREILGVMRYSKWPYILILGLPLNSCRQYIEAAYEVEPITDLTCHLTDVYAKEKASIKCVHQKALIR